jgi:hypothetical protein
MIGGIRFVSPAAASFMTASGDSAAAVSRFARSDFAWEQAAEGYGRLVVDWVNGGYRRVGAG